MQITDFIAVLSLVLTAFGLGYTIGSKQKSNHLIVPWRLLNQLMG